MARLASSQVPLSFKKILLGVCGGIAAYKACDLVRRLRDLGAEVHVVMSQAACEFVTPMTFQALSGHPVHTKLFDLEQESKISHIALADLADLIVVAPATADLLAKLAHGNCDDLMTTLLAASTKPKLICPSMNVNMWNNPANQENLKALRSRGIYFMEPGTGSLACGYEGIGRLPEPEEIAQCVNQLLSESQLKGLKILITAGPTWEPLDPVRHLANPSSGKTGFLLAERAQMRGAHVTLVSGPTSLSSPSQVELIRVKTAEEMAKAVFKVFPQVDVAICTAAVSDFRPKKPLAQKVKKEKASLILELTRNVDILGGLGQEKKKGQLLVGFAAETEHVKEEALRKLKKKNLDLICANDVSRPGLGFASDQNQLTLFWANGRSKTLPVLSKRELSDCILEALEEILKDQNKLLSFKSSKRK